MTRAEALDRKAQLEAQRNELVDQLAATDVTSATISAGGGSKSFTNRTVADLKAKISFLDKEIARINVAITGARTTIRTIVPNYVH